MTRPHLVTMSGLHRGLRCAYSVRSDVARTRRPSGAAARLGTRAHGLVAHVLGYGDPPALLPEADGLKAEADAQKIATNVLAWLGTWRERGGKLVGCEVGLLYDADADEAHEGLRRDEPGYETHTRWQVPGTLDLVLLDPDGGLVVVDLKTGSKSNAHREQLHIQGLAAARRHGKASVRVGFLWGRLRKVDDPELEALDADRLDVEAGRIRRLLRVLPTAEPTRGELCTYCEVTECPAKEAELRQVAYEAGYTEVA